MTQEDDTTQDTSGEDKTAKTGAKPTHAKTEMPIFARTFDFLQWLLQASNHLPRAYRHSFTQRLLNAAFDLRERLEEANARKGAAGSIEKCLGEPHLNL